MNKLIYINQTSAWNLLYLISEEKDEIEVCVKEAESCLQLLLPAPDNFLQNLGGEEAPSNSSKLIGDSYQSRLCSQEIDHKANALASKSSNFCSNVKELCDVPNRMEVDSAGEVEGNDNEKCHRAAESDKDEDESADDEDDGAEERLHGLPGPDRSIVIDLGQQDNLTIQETTDNTDVMQTLKESSKVINSNFLPKVTRWLEVGENISLCFCKMYHLFNPSDFLK